MLYLMSDKFTVKLCYAVQSVSASGAFLGIGNLDQNSVQRCRPKTIKTVADVTNDV